MIGKLEELVLLAVIKAGSQVVPSVAYEHFLGAANNGKSASFGSFYTTLERLSKKGLLKMEPISEEGGRSRKSYTISSSGRIAVSDSVGSSFRLGALALAGG
jgi:hypothetical protein